MVAAQLPPFLAPFTPKYSLNLPSVCQNAYFTHRGNLGSSQALWWTPRDQHCQPNAVLLFIPGNPGLVDFYIPFLSTIHENYTHLNLGILAHSHLDHYAGLERKPEGRYSQGEFLSIQVQSTIEVLDAILSYYTPSTKIILVGHSVGSWIISQILKERKDYIKAVFLLFPTLSNIANTPNGKLLHPIFAPLSRHILSSFSFLIGFLPRSLLSALYSSWPEQQLRVLQNFLSSKTTIFSALTMGAEEMSTIKQLEAHILKENKEKIYAYYAQQDDWVGEERQVIFNLLDPDCQSSQVVQGSAGVPHAFCISE
uniref:Lipid droplet-associated hydrolase n=1 Tax=Psilocybe cubensis TaxID=181762 RepID=A0A8H7YAS9_PSICU